MIRSDPPLYMEEKCFELQVLLNGFEQGNAVRNALAELFFDSACRLLEGFLLFVGQLDDFDAIFLKILDEQGIDLSDHAAAADRRFLALGHENVLQILG